MISYVYIIFIFLRLCTEYELNESNNESDKSDISCDGHMQFSDEERDEIASLKGPQYSFRDEETRSRFTEYSMSSSVMRRNEQLTLLDDKFEKVIDISIYHLVNILTIILYVLYIIFPFLFL